MIDLHKHIIKGIALLLIPTRFYGVLGGTSDFGLEVLGSWPRVCHLLASMLGSLFTYLPMKLMMRFMQGPNLGA